VKLNIPIRALSINKAFQGRRFKSKEHRQYEKDIHNLIRYSKNALCGDIEAHYTFYIKNIKMTDADNLVKCLQDILVSMNYIKDDRYISRYIIEKKYSKDEHIEVEYSCIKTV